MRSFTGSDDWVCGLQAAIIINSAITNILTDNDNRRLIINLFSLGGFKSIRNRVIWSQLYAKIVPNFINSCLNGWIHLDHLRPFATIPFFRQLRSRIDPDFAPE